MLLFLLLVDDDLVAYLPLLKLPPPTSVGPTALGLVLARLQQVRVRVSLRVGVKGRGYE